MEARALAWCLSGTIVLTGCSLLLSSEDYAGGDAVTPSSTQAPDAGDAAPPVSVPDAGSGSAAVTPREAGPAPFCATLTPKPTFCQDFDVSEDVSTGWLFDSTVGTGATIARDTSAFVSPPGSVRFALGAGIPGTSAGFIARLGYKPMLPGTIVRAEAKTRIDDVDAVAKPYLLGLSFGPDAFVAVRASKTDAVLFQQIRTATGYSGTEVKLAKLIPTLAWVTLELTVSLDQARSASVRMNGEVVLAPVALPAAFAVGALPEFTIGPALFAAVPVGPTLVRYDDVVLDVR